MRLRLVALRRRGPSRQREMVVKLTRGEVVAVHEVLRERVARRAEERPTEQDGYAKLCRRIADQLERQLG